jgi:HD-GYP domain-containing protein (c-di-GMP phosphodiesterase class II)
MLVNDQKPNEKRPPDVDTYSSIPTSNIRRDTSADFNLYMRSKDNKYILYRGANTTITEAHKETLNENGVKRLYIQGEDQQKYLHYVEKHMSSILSSSAPVEEKASILYQSTNQLIQDVMDKPDLGENIERVDQLVDTTINDFMDDERNLLKMIYVMAFDYTLYTHSVNVTVFGLALGRQLKLSQEDLHCLGMGLMLHDVGKIQVPPEVLFKAGPLTDDEWNVMRQHPTMGEMLLTPSGKVNQRSMNIVRGHHEKTSGKGYPDGLTIEKIDPLAKIAAIADVFDALTTERVYKDAILTFPALKIMMNEMAGSFDQDYLRKFIQMLNLAEGQDKSEKLAA